MMLEGVSHAQFLSGPVPINVRNKDLVPDVTLEDAHNMTATSMVAFFDQIISGHKPSLDIKSSYDVLKPMVDALEYEGYYYSKPACNNKPYLINPDDVTCLHGSPWNAANSQIQMGGELPNSTMKINSNDNFHDVEETNPVHLSEIDTKCAADSKNCTVEIVTVTQNYYGDFDKMDTGYHPQAASEMKSKMSSRQKVQEYAGVNSKNDFTADDEDGNRCAEINDIAIKWAYDNLRPEAKSNYDQFGVKLVTGDDMGPYNAGPLWIWTLMDYTESEDGT